MDIKHPEIVIQKMLTSGKRIGLESAGFFRASVRRVCRSIRARPRPPHRPRSQSFCRGRLSVFASVTATRLRLYCLSLSVISVPVPVIACINLVADDAADHGPADGSNRAAIRQDGARDATDAGTDRSILILSRHSATTAQADQHGQGHRTAHNSSYRFHWNISLSKI